MGREIRRVPLDFDFPLDESYADYEHDKHRNVCKPGSACYQNEHEDAPYWRDTLPKGEGWQLWQTVSDGPISPVFATPEELIDWMSRPVPEHRRLFYAPEAYPPNPGAQGWARETARRFVLGSGWLPSGVIAGGRVLTTTEIVMRQEAVRAPAEDD